MRHYGLLDRSAARTAQTTQVRGVEIGPNFVQQVLVLRERQDRGLSPVRSRRSIRARRLGQPWQPQDSDFDLQ
jgi:hypothetical protein